MVVVRWVKAAVWSILVGMLVVTGVSYRTLAQMTSRPVYSAERQATFKKNRELLCSEHGARDVSCITHDGIKLSGLFIERPNAQRAILICHGYGMCKEEMLRYVALFPHDTIVLFDFRSHGNSEGDLISVGYYEQRDVRAAADFLRKQPGLSSIPLIGIGVSMGGATLLQAAANGVPFDGLIIDSSFSHLPSQIAHSFKMYTGLPKAIFMPMVLAMYTYKAGCTPHEVIPARSIASVECPVLLVHSEDDATAPVANVHVLYAAIHHTKKSLWVVHNAKHAHIVHTYPEEYVKHVQDFLVEV